MVLCAFPRVLNMKNISEFPFGPGGGKKESPAGIRETLSNKRAVSRFVAISLEHEWCAEREQPFHAHLNCPEPPPSPAILHPVHVGEKHGKNHLKRRVRNQKVYFSPCKKKVLLFFLLLLLLEVMCISYFRGAFEAWGQQVGAG